MHRHAQIADGGISPDRLVNEVAGKVDATAKGSGVTLLRLWEMTKTTSAGMAAVDSSLIQRRGVWRAQ